MPVLEAHRVWQNLLIRRSRAGLAVPMGLVSVGEHRRRAHLAKTCNLKDCQWMPAVEGSFL